MICDLYFSNPIITTYQYQSIVAFSKVKIQQLSVFHNLEFPLYLDVSVIKGHSDVNINNV